MSSPSIATLFFFLSSKAITSLAVSCRNWTPWRSNRKGRCCEKKFRFQSSKQTEICKLYVFISCVYIYIYIQKCRLIAGKFGKNTWNFSAGGLSSADCNSIIKGKIHPQMPGLHSWSPLLENVQKMRTSSRIFRTKIFPCLV